MKRLRELDAPAGTPIAEAAALMKAGDVAPAAGAKERVKARIAQVPQTHDQPPRPLSVAAAWTAMGAFAAAAAVTAAVWHGRARPAPEISLAPEVGAHVEAPRSSSPPARPANAPPRPRAIADDVVFTGGFETGDLSEWHHHGVWGTGALAVTDERAHEGRHALRATLGAASSGYSQAVVTREGPFPPEAIYSAWFYLPAAQAARPYWTIFKFRSRVDARDDATWVDLWDLVVHPHEDGTLRPYLYMHGAGDFAPVGAERPPLPIGRWFSVEAFLRTSTADSGRLAFWIDGVRAFDVSGRATTPTSPFVSWTVGSAGVESPGVTMFVDDVRIRRVRVEP